jgi:hypothetical protein
VGSQPPNIPPLPPRQPYESTRDLYERATGGPACAACHRYVNPPGYAFEHYDAMGGYRAEDAYRAVDASGTLANVASVAFKDALDLSRQIAGTNDARACMATQWLRWLLRRREIIGERPAIDAAVAEAAPDFDLRKVLVALTRSRAFTHRILSPGEQP